MNLVLIEKEVIDELFNKLNYLTAKLQSNESKNQLSENWISNKDLAKVMDVSFRTLQQYRDNGTLSYSKIGSKIYYEIKEVDSLLRTNIIE